MCNISYNDVVWNQINSIPKQNYHFFFIEYLDLGILPIRYEIMRRKLAFLRYLLQQDKESMVFKILKATDDDPAKNDFVQACKST